MSDLRIRISALGVTLLVATGVVLANGQAVDLQYCPGGTFESQSGCGAPPPGVIYPSPPPPCLCGPGPSPPPVPGPTDPQCDSDRRPDRPVLQDSTYSVGPQEAVFSARVPDFMAEASYALWRARDEYGTVVWTHLTEGAFVSRDGYPRMPDEQEIFGASGLLPHDANYVDVKFVEDPDLDPSSGDPVDESCWSLVGGVFTRNIDSTEPAFPSWIDPATRFVDHFSRPYTLRSLCILGCPTVACPTGTTCEAGGACSRDELQNPCGNAAGPAWSAPSLPGGQGLHVDSFETLHGPFFGVDQSSSADYIVDCPKQRTWAQMRMRRTSSISEQIEIKARMNQTGGYAAKMGVKKQLTLFWGEPIDPGPPPTGTPPVELVPTTCESWSTHPAMGTDVWLSIEVADDSGGVPVVTGQARWGGCTDDPADCANVYTCTAPDPERQGVMTGLTGRSGMTTHHRDYQIDTFRGGCAD